MNVLILFACLTLDQIEKKKTICGEKQYFTHKKIIRDVGK